MTMEFDKSRKNPTSLPTVVLLCAGRSERFIAQGGRGNKLEAIVGAKSVRDHVLKAIEMASLPYVIVEPKDLEDSERISNSGMGDSIACGVSKSRQSNGWLVLPADLPLIQSSTLQLIASHLTLRTQLLDSEWVTVAPGYAGQRGHPVGFSSGFLNSLVKLRGDEGARRILQEYPPHLVDVNDQGCVLDVDTPELLDKARKIWLQMSSNQH